MSAPTTAAEAVEVEQLRSPVTELRSALNDPAEVGGRRATGGVVVFHGTRIDWVQSIASEGLRAKRWRGPGRPRAVYVTELETCARAYAAHQAAYCMEFDGLSKPIGLIVRLQVPADSLEPDPEAPADERCFFSRRPIAAASVTGMWAVAIEGLAFDDAYRRQAAAELRGEYQRHAERLTARP